MTSNLTPDLEPSDVTPVLHTAASGLLLPDSDGHGPLIAATPPATLPFDMGTDTSLPTALNAGVVGTGGSTALQADQLRADFGVSGTGVKIGVISDSFNVLGGGATDEADGDLPTSGVTVLAEGQAGDTDEGRAMLELVHQIAPGAQLFFATSGTTDAGEAANIQALRNAGCNIIVDDTTFLDEPFFQPDVISQAIDSVVASGAMFFTSAGNEAGNAYQSAWRGADNDTAFNFNSGGGAAVTTQSVTIGAGASIVFDLQWNQPFGSPTSQLNLTVTDAFGDMLTAQQEGTVDFEGHAQTVLGVENTSASSLTLNLSITKLSGPDPGLIKYIALGDGFPVSISGANTGTVFGHHEDPNAITVGAANAATPTTPEPFTSSGAGSELLFNANGSPVNEPVNEVDLTGVDGIATSVFPDFLGTSAAAPTAAAVAALLEQAAPGDSNAQIEQALENTTENIGPSATTGFGLVQALTAAESIGAPHVFQANNAADVIFLGSGTNTVIGGAGNDTIFITEDSSNSIISGSGNDTLDYAAAPGAVVLNLAAGTASNGFGGTDTFTNIAAVIGSRFNDTFIAGPGNHTLNGGAGENEVSYAGASAGVTVNLLTRTAANGFGGTDLLLNIETVIGSGFNDTLIAAGGDSLLAGAGQNVLIAFNNSNMLLAGGGATMIEIAGNANVVQGGAGTDNFAAGGNNNLLVAGTGATAMTVSGNANLLFGGAGSDLLFVKTGSHNVLTTGSGNGTLEAIGGANTLRGGAGTDVLIAFNNSNMLIAGSGATSIEIAGTADVVQGGPGNNHFAVGGNNNLLVAGAGATAMTVSGNANLLFGGSGNDILRIASGAANTLIGGSGVTTLDSNAGGNTLKAGTGPTVAFYSGLAGALTVNLQAGTADLGGSSASDTLSGISDAFVSGNASVTDVVIGTMGGHDTLAAGAGNVQLQSFGEDNLLEGGSGLTQMLVRMVGGNTLVAGTGPSTEQQAFYLTSNTVVNLTTQTASASSGTDMLAGVASAVSEGTHDTLIGGTGNGVLIAFNNANTLIAGSGTTALEVAGSGDLLVGGAGIDNLAAGGNDDTLVAGGGATMMMASGSGNLLEGGTGSDLLKINNGNGNKLEAGSGNNTLEVFDAENTLIGGGGTDVLIAFQNANTLIAGTGATLLEVAGSGDVLQGGSGTDDLAVSGNNDTLIAGSGATSMSATGNRDVLEAGAGSDMLVENFDTGFLDTFNTLVAGSGVDTLVDSNTGDSYDFKAADGQATIVNGASSNAAASNTLAFGAGLNDENLWFLRSGSNLQIDLMGTASEVTVDGWFSSAGNQLKEITAGGLKIDSQVATLVQAMATFETNNPAFNPTATATAPNDPTLQAAIAHAWHT